MNNSTNKYDVSNQYLSQLSIHEIAKQLKTEYHEGLYINVSDLLFKLIAKLDVNDDVKDSLYNKALACQDKISMMFYSYEKSLKTLRDFEITQNMDFPCLFGQDETELLFYTESMIILARTALDIIAAILFQTVYDTRGDSFNKFSKKIKKDSNTNIVNFKNAFLKYENTDLHAYLLLCGSEKGRALRDQLIHQTTIKLEYNEYGNGEKEMLFILLNKGEVYVPFRLFCSWFVLEVCDIVLTMTNTALNYIEEDK